MCSGCCRLSASADVSTASAGPARPTSRTREQDGTTVQYAITRGLRPAHHRQRPGPLRREIGFSCPRKQAPLENVINEASPVPEQSAARRLVAREDDGQEHGLQPDGATAPLLHRGRLRRRQLLGVHARRRLGLQPGVAEPNEVPPRRRDVRRRGVRARGRHHVPGAGDRRLAVELPDRGDRRATLARSASSVSATPTSAPT